MPAAKWELFQLKTVDKKEHIMEDIKKAIEVYTAAIHDKELKSALEVYWPHTSLGGWAVSLTCHPVEDWKLLHVSDDNSHYAIVDDNIVSSFVRVFEKYRIDSSNLIRAQAGWIDKHPEIEWYERREDKRGGVSLRRHNPSTNVI